MNICYYGLKLHKDKKIHTPQEKEAQMYDLAYIEPRLGGYIYRINRKCGHQGCKCAFSSYRHPFYRLEYRVKENGRWKKK